jgi:hypothetical protein
MREAEEKGVRIEDGLRRYSIKGNRSSLCELYYAMKMYG